jgi:CHAD domain-containing protein
MAKARVITGLDLQSPTAQNARIIAQERLADMYAYTEYIDNIENTQELHDLRIATKRVRYTLEVFAEFLPLESQSFAEELATLQDELGNLHDSEVMLALLHRALHLRQKKTLSKKIRKPLLSADLIADIQNTSSAPTDKERQGLLSFLHKQEQRREQCYIAFRQHWDQLEQSGFRAKLLGMLKGV